MSTTKLRNHRQFTKYCESIGLLMMNNLSSALKSFFISLNILVFMRIFFQCAIIQSINVVINILSRMLVTEAQKELYMAYQFILSYSYYITLPRYSIAIFSYDFLGYSNKFSKCPFFLM